MNAVVLVRALVVALVFPVFTHLIYSVITLPLRPALMPFFEQADARAEMWDRAFTIVALLAALRGAFAICRRLWPERTFQEMVRAREADEAKRRPHPQPEPPAI